MQNLVSIIVAAFAVVAAPVAASAQNAGFRTDITGDRAVAVRNSLGGSSTTYVSVSAEQKSTIRRKLSHGGDRIAKSSLGGVSIAVGAKLPREKVRISRLPTELIQIAPEYSAYEYFVTDDGLVVIVDPDSYEIVDVIAA